MSCRSASRSPRFRDACHRGCCVHAPCPMRRSGSPWRRHAWVWACPLGSVVMNKPTGSWTLLHVQRTGLRVALEPRGVCACV